MKYLIILLLFFSAVVNAQTLITGKVIDAETNEPLADANISVSWATGEISGTTTDTEGKFNLQSNWAEGSKLTVSYVGYETRVFSINDLSGSAENIIRLHPVILQSQTVLVKGTIGDERVTPTSFAKISRKEIDENYTLQDIPEYLSYLPSTTFYSENGNGLGYNYLSIRGFGQRRISISVNGIPQNDPEDQNLYWIDVNDLLDNSELVQVQRGAGSGLAGYPAVGGSINILTSAFSAQRFFKFSSSAGSYNTIKNSASFASGIINEKYSVYARLGQVRSGGYRNNSWVNFTQFYLSAVRYDKKLTTQVNFYGGPLSDGLAYYGLPKSYINDRALRKTNWSGTNEIENFWQPHLELLNEYKFNENLVFNSALFLVIGKGFFDYDGSWSIYYDDYFRLKENGFDSTAAPQNALIRAQVENNQWGWIPRIRWKHTNGELILGGEIRLHNSIHWGGINFAEGIPAGVPKDYRYYYYEGGNNIYNVYAHEMYRMNEDLNVLAELQLAYHRYKIDNEKYVGNNFQISGLYLNPRLGVNYNISEKLNSYVSFARVTKEPRLKNYYDAAESSGGATPQFELKPDGDYDFSSPLVQPETMNDLELGFRYAEKNFGLSLNFYYMLFKDEIIKNGLLDRFGQPVTGNIDKTTHLGIEFTGHINFLHNFELIVNGALSRNQITNGTQFGSYTNISSGNDTTGAIDLSGNTIGGFPQFMMNAILNVKFSGFLAQIKVKYLDDFYSDNFGNKFDEYLDKYPGIVSYDDNVVDAYLIANLFMSYDFSLGEFFKDVKIFGQVNNVFDYLYAAYAVGGDFFPAAERNFLFGLKVGI